MRHHQFRSVGASGIRYSVVPLRTQVSPEEKERGEQWKGFAGKIRHEVQKVASQLVATQTHIEETTAASLSNMEKRITAIAAQQKQMEEMAAVRQSHIEAQLERLLEAYSSGVGGSTIVEEAPDAEPRAQSAGGMTTGRLV